MPHIHLSGKVIPISVPANSGLGLLPPICFTNEDTGQTETFHIRIRGIHVDVLIDLESFQAEDAEIYRNKALDLARSALDAYNFVSGAGLTLYLDRLHYPDGRCDIIVPGYPELAQIHKYKPEDVGELYVLFASDPRLHMSLNDLTLAITWPHAAAVNCARAVEGIRTVIAPGKRSAGWPVMQEALNLTEDFMKMITGLSEGPRHGDREWIAPEPLEEVIRRSWMVMVRYLEWKKGGETRLSLSAFPLL